MIKCKKCGNDTIIINQGYTHFYCCKVCGRLKLEELDTTNYHLAHLYEGRQVKVSELIKDLNDKETKGV